MKYLALIPLLLLIHCTQIQENAERAKGIEAISLLGDTLYTANNELPAAITNRIDSLIQVAESEGDDLSVIVWKARLLGYEGKYQEAITELTKGIDSELGNESLSRATLLRHRGHRFISTRQFENAISDFQKATSLIEGTNDVIEPDGLPNAQNIPLSSLHTNVWYHLGLSYYVTGNFEASAISYEQCALASTNDDMRVAAWYWQYMSLVRLNKVPEAQEILDSISTEMEIIENDAYHQLLLLFKGILSPEELLGNTEDALTNATLGYGLGFYYFINQNNDEATNTWQSVYDAGNWASFGYIASEAELANQ